MKDKQQPLSVQILACAECGFTLAVLAVAGYYAGYWFDNESHSSPLWALVGIFAGFALGLALVFRRVNQLETLMANDSKEASSD